VTDKGKESAMGFMDLLGHVPESASSNVTCLSFNRWGGKSLPPFHELNVSVDTGDRIENVLENLELIRRSARLGSVVSVRQVHGNRFYHVQTPKDFPGHIVNCQDEADGIFSRFRGVGILIKTADCQAVVMFDPKNAVVANIHCGWRGNVNGILPSAVREMEVRYGSNPRDLWVGISPSLGPCCAEFKGWKRLLPKWMHEYQVRPDYFDFWAISRSQLTGAGVPDKQIFCAQICTTCNGDYFSYRREGTTGRLGTVIALV